MNYDKIFSEITDRIIGQGKRGVKPWHQSWSKEPISSFQRFSNLIPGRAGRKFVPIPTADAVIKASGARICLDDTVETPRYNVEDDEVVLLDPKRFESPETFYAAVFHELGHWTASRVGRYPNGGANIRSYAIEEMTAEFTAALVCGALGIDVIDNSAAYIVGWFGNGRCSIEHRDRAIAQAKTAAAYLLHKAEAPALQMAA